eukprot:10318302-Karenia_brevis.AAC.1
MLVITITLKSEASQIAMGSEELCLFLALPTMHTRMKPDLTNDARIDLCEHVAYEGRQPEETIAW